MTAAHCTQDSLRIRIYYGAHKLSNAMNRVKMTNYVIHEKYQFPNYDTSIITVAKPFEFSDNVGPVCLPSSIFSSGIESGDKLIGLGWGRTENSG